MMYVKNLIHSRHLANLSPLTALFISVSPLVNLVQNVTRSRVSRLPNYILSPNFEKINK